ncbi:hypothetical protein [Mycobacterium sp. GA-1199]|uniref:hypothetical protein n=1 Tax=Mycobacterium sp. GA-1199 TaxID=1772287 RepID=UPI000A73AED3|nr:hypothetical protein [Mycobacterium sp. GA-1199]
MIDYAEQQTLERICRFHGADKPELIEHLARLIGWAHQSEAAKYGGPEPPFLLVLESVLGLHTKREPKETSERLKTHRLAAALVLTQR